MGFFCEVAIQVAVLVGVEESVEAHERVVECLFLVLFRTKYRNVVFVLDCGYICWSNECFKFGVFLSASLSLQEAHFVYNDTQQRNLWRYCHCTTCRLGYAGITDQEKEIPIFTVGLVHCMFIPMDFLASLIRRNLS